MKLVSKITSLILIAGMLGCAQSVPSLKFAPVPPVTPRVVDPTNVEMASQVVFDSGIAIPQTEKIVSRTVEAPKGAETLAKPTPPVYSTNQNSVPQTRHFLITVEGKKASVVPLPPEKIPVIVPKKDEGWTVWDYVLYYSIAAIVLFLGWWYLIKKRTTKSLVQALKKVWQKIWGLPDSPPSRTLVPIQSTAVVVSPVSSEQSAPAPLPVPSAPPMKPPLSSQTLSQVPPLGQN